MYIKTHKRMYLSSILWFLSWPVFIAISFFAIRWVIRKVEQKNPPEEDQA